MPNQPPIPQESQLPNYYTSPKVIALKEWLPDQQPYAIEGAMTIARNVLPRTVNSYGPLGSLMPLTNIAALPDTPIALYSFEDQFHNEHIFVGTRQSLFRLTSNRSSFIDVSKNGTFYSASVNHPWVFVSFGTSIIASNGSDAVQVMDLNIDTGFDDLNAARAPLGAYMAVVRDFLFFGNLIEAQTGVHYPNRVHWSAIGDPARYPDVGSDEAASTLSDVNDFPTGFGAIRGIVSDLQQADVAIFMEYAIYIGLFSPGGQIFNFQLAQGAAGCRVPNSIVRHYGKAYYLGLDGWYEFNGTTTNAIGAQKIDHFFLTDPNDGADPLFIQLTQGAADPTGKYIVWLYCGPNSNGLFNRVLFYEWNLQRWSLARINVRLLGKSLSVGFTLDELDQFGRLDQLPASLDDPRWDGGVPYLAGFDENDRLGLFNGPSLAGILESVSFELTPSHRSRVTSARPILDSGIPTIAIGSQNRLEDAVVYNNDQAINIFGESPTRVDGRYIRTRVTIPASTQWTYCSGVEVDFAKSTKR